MCAKLLKCTAAHAQKLPSQLVHVDIWLGWNSCLGILVYAPQPWTMVTTNTTGSPHTLLKVVIASLQVSSVLLWPLKLGSSSSSAWPLKMVRKRGPKGCFFCFFRSSFETEDQSTSIKVNSLGAINTLLTTVHKV